MSGSIASASAEQSAALPGRRELIVSVNWIGDAIMAMPALQMFRRQFPESHLTVLARGVIADLWKLHGAPDNVIKYSGRPNLTNPLFTTLRRESFDRAWLLPNSFRSAWITFRSGIPVRTGYAGGLRHVLLNDAVEKKIRTHQIHQAWEYINLMTPESSISSIPKPALSIPAEARAAAWNRFGAWTNPVIGMIPGAARGPSKRWPAEHFIAVAKHFLRDGFRIALFGGADDRDVCAGIAREVGDAAMDFSGKTSLVEWGALLEACALVVANDSGGMHLAAALGCPVIALYGRTDPEKTGPLGDECRIMQNSGKRSRDVSRNSAEAIASLAAIRPESVIEASRTMLQATRRQHE